MKDFNDNADLKKMLIPHEISIGEVYMPPMLIAGILGTLAAYLTKKLFNKYRWSIYFFYPPIVMISLMVIYTLIIGWMIIPF